MRVTPEDGPRTRRVGAAAIEAALDRGEPIRALFLRRLRADSPEPALATRARNAGALIRQASDRELARLARGADDCDALGVFGPAPTAGRDEVMRHLGAVWLLCGVAYPGNAGAAIRTAEVSGAAGVFVDARLDRAGRRDALRAAMRADRFMPVRFEPAREVLAAARAAGRRVVGIEETGDRPPWADALAGPVLLVVGGEVDGIPKPVLAACDSVVRLPSSGVIPSYNLQAAVAAVATERLRQLSGDRS